MRRLLFLCLLPILLCTGCAATGTAAASSQEPRDHTPVVNLPSADGTTVYGNDLVTLDASHTDDGYLMIQYKGNSSKVKFQLTGPDAVTYTYDLEASPEYDTFPLSSDDGDYLVEIYENIQEDRYALAYSDTVSVSLKNEYTPFLYPNQFVNYTADTKAVAKGASLVENATTDLEALTAIYNYAVQTIAYDEEKAKTATSGYLPDIDETLETKKGICFDYAALMCCMLRTQRIPAKLQIGYAGDVYHAWISTYLDESGWVDNIIQFDGVDWELMDPTFASSAQNDSSINDFIRDSSNYIVKYSR